MWIQIINVKSAKILGVKSTRIMKFKSTKTREGQIRQKRLCEENKNLCAQIEKATIARFFLVFSCFFLDFIFLTLSFSRFFLLA